MTILYFHGFASHGKSWKAEELRKNINSENIIAPTWPVNPLEVKQQAENILNQLREPVLFIGSSLGGFYSYYMSVLFNMTAILINPALTPWIGLDKYLGINTRFDTGETFIWKKSYLSCLERMNKQISNLEANHQNLYFFLASDDEILDHSNIKDRFPEAGLIKFYDDCGHRFNRFSEIIPWIKKIQNTLNLK